MQGCVSDYRSIQGTLRDKMCQELGLESLKLRRWCKRFGFIVKVIMEEAPNYLMQLIPKCEQNIRTRNNHIPTYHCRKDCFKYSFFPSILNDWFDLDDSIRKSELILILKCSLSFIRAIQNMV